MVRAAVLVAGAAAAGGALADARGVALPMLVCAVAVWVVARGVAINVRSAALVALAAGVASHAARVPPAFAEKPHTIVVHGTVCGDVRASSYGSAFPLATDSEGTLEVAASGAVPAAGDRLVVRGRIEPFDGPRNPGEPSQAALAEERGVRAHLVRARVLSSQPPTAWDIHAWIPRARAWAGERIRARIAEPEASILAGALWGEKGALPPDLRAEFQDTGTTHVLVTAGLHLGVIAALCAWLLGRAGCGRVSSSLGVIGTVWLYAAVSGAHLPSLRAATMLSFGLAAHAAGRSPFSWNALGAAALVIALLWPASVDTLSFALSFSCVAAIMLFAKPLAHAFAGAGLPGFAGETLSLTLATQAGTWPLTAAAFLVIAPYSVIANALVVPVVGLAMLGGIAVLAVTPLPPLAHVAANVDGVLLEWIVSAVRFVAALPGAHIVATPPPAWAVAVYDVAMAGVAFLARARRFGPAAALFAGAVALVVAPPRPQPHDLRITLVDVGQADGIVIRTPAGHVLLVDAGGRLERGPAPDGESPAEEVGERVIVPFLVRAGAHRVDAVLLSHPHGDHAGGVAPVLRTLGAGVFADSGQIYPGHAYRDALDVAAQRHVAIAYPRRGTVWHTDDGVTLRFFSPALPLIANTRNDINNNSLVFRVEYGRFGMLFAGDAGAEAEERILASGADVRADVLKVGHHGSAYSSTPEFIRAVSPRYAVISVGRDNLFGHPARSTIDTLRDIGATVYRTDEGGSVAISTDGFNTTIQAFLAR